MADEGVGSGSGEPPHTGLVEIVRFGRGARA